MDSQQTSVFSNGLLWFGAGISIAEILTGMLLSPLGWEKGLWAIFIGHIIGGAVMLGAGIMGARSRCSAMETVSFSFGKEGARFFAGINVIQLIGWTAVMIVSAAAAAEIIVPLGMALWDLIIGALIALWIIMGMTTLGRVNVLVMTALFLLTAVLSGTIFGADTAAAPSGTITFGGAVELAVAMPLSWLPVISDYTREAEKPVKATVVSCLTYFAASSWMFVIGMGAALFTGESDIARIMLGAGLGVSAIVIILLSTVTTTFLDAYSAGVSGRALTTCLSEKGQALIATALGTLLAITVDASRFEDFLYFIGSVFAPMTAIMLADYFFIHENHQKERVSVLKLLIWAIGFGLYRYLLNADTPLGVTFPVIVAVMVMDVVVSKIVGQSKNRADLK